RDRKKQIDDPRRSVHNRTSSLGEKFGGSLTSRQVICVGAPSGLRKAKDIDEASINSKTIVIR
ncbi:MAG: hypothetical protein AB2807_06265, partial [Candidatus Sedimenticola endophacoides]